MSSRHPRVFVALSGGVDSSVAAALLKARGFNVVGIHMALWAPLEARANGAAAPTSRRGLPLTGWAPRENHEAGSMNHGFATVCWQQQQDRLDAIRVAAKLDIPFQTWDFTAEYRGAVVEYMIREYAAGRTPNPDVMCNHRIKFGVFLERALASGADYVATGHYIRKSEIRNPESETNSKTKIQNSKLCIARDSNKDQSYFLWTLTQEQLSRCLFPIGEYTKPEVREMARRFGLPTSEKPDSQGICFIGEIDVRDFLKTYIPERRGRVLTTAGRVVGEHGGAEFYTIGQRQGIGIGGGIPYYVADKDTTANTLTVAEGPYDEKLYRRELVAADVNWISGRPPRQLAGGGFPLRCEARIRYRQPLQPCLVSRTTYHETQDHLVARDTGYVIRAQFDEPQRAVTPGQSIVFYQQKSFDSAQDIEMLGGAIIS